jgi:crossover junction endodeoxyribonuclease RuvC
MEKRYLGIDPGKTGGLGLIDQEGLVTFCKAMPALNNEVDVIGLIKLIEENRPTSIILEDVHSIHLASAKANFQFGKTLGLIEAVCLLAKIQLIKVKPMAWQRVSLDGVPKSGNTKERALAGVRRLYPNLNLKASSRCIKDHDGIVDAILLARYAFIQKL